MTAPDPRRILPPEQPDLDAESRVTPADLAIAPRFWAHYGTPLLKRLLNARRDDR